MRFAVHLAVLLPAACIKSQAIQNSTVAMEEVVAVQEQSTAVDPEPAEKEPCSEESDYTLDLSQMKLGQSNGMTVLAFVYRDITMSDEKKHVVLCLSSSPENCLPGEACTDFTRCCNRSNAEPEPEVPQDVAASNAANG